MPRIVKAPLPFAPQRCLLTSTEDGELVDFGDAQINEPVFRLYLHRGVVEEAARECCGMLPASEVDALRLRVEAYEDKIRELSADIDAMRAFEDRFGKNLEAGVTAGINIEPAVYAGEEGAEKDNA